MAKLSDQELREKLDAFNVGDPDTPLSFAARLARENGWSHDFAERVVAEYKRFIYLVARASHPVTPSEQIDQAWHLHLVYTESYWREMCDEILGQPIHHHPTYGGLAEGEKFVDQYERTLASYREHFGEEPPNDIWPSSDERFAPPAARWVDTSRHWLIRKPGFLKNLRLSRKSRTFPFAKLAALTLIVFATLILAGCAMINAPMDWKGSDFLKLFACLIVAALLLSLGIVWIIRGQPLRFAPLSDPYEIAFLSGGGKRAVDAALARLYGKRLITIDRHKKAPYTSVRLLNNVHDLELSGLEKTVYLALPGSHSSTSLPSLRAALKPAVKSIRDRLRAAGLLFTGAQKFGIGLLAALPFLAVIAFGISKFMVGISRDKPVFFLLVLLFLTFIIMSFRLSALRRRTATGQALWKKLRRELKQPMKNLSGTTAEENIGQIALAVAILGTPALVSAAGYQELKHPLHTPGISNGSSGGCGAGCGTGGDGGGGCGGGGCGGCGG